MQGPRGHAHCHLRAGNGEPVLQAENAYAAAVMADTQELQQQLVAEMRGRIQEADQTAPIRCSPPPPPWRTPALQR